MAWLYQAHSSTKGIQMGNEEWGHRMEIGTNWTKIRVGCRIMVNAIQAFDGPDTGCLALGVCHGTEQMFKSPTCTEFMGFVLGNSTTPNWSYAVSTTAYASNPRPHPITIQNGVRTNRNTGSAFYYVSAADTVRTVAYVDITKNSATNYTIAPWMPGNTTQAQADNSFAAFIWSMENNTTPLNANTIITGTFDYTGPGLMDSLYFGWGKSVPAITLFDLAACRLL